jgi:serine/threonine protein kinase/tetratricopeptide (TPR) repeat protein
LSDTRHRELEEIFGAAVGKHTTAERNAYLDGACGEDAELRAKVDALLRAHDDAGTFLDRPPIDTDATIAAGGGDERAGMRIGAYKLLQLIGEGGFGRVYMAEQEYPVRRKVALKIIKLGMDTRQVIARFEAERQALALMDHANIATVLDAGATETGRPYFVMELVKGISITKYCDESRLTTRARLELFVQVCHAVQHAHQKGVIHRDIKPSNVLVTLHDSRPVPKIIDFGIAKATSQRLTDKTLFTEFRQFIGTPEYMSPDQAEISGLDVDTRTDIYSLGVLLYELLTGSTPFESKSLRSAGFDEIKRIIREVEPPMPSTRLQTLSGSEAGSTVASLRQTEPAHLSRMVKGDLDWIVMKALEKDRTRRYQTAAELAQDVDRHLGDQPVLAGPPGVLYKARKFVVRNRVGVAAMSVVLLALLGGLSVATIGYLQAVEAQRELARERDAANVARGEAEAARRNEQTLRRQAEASAARALTEARRAAAASEFLSEMLSALDPRQARGRTVTVRYLLDEATERLAEGALAEQPDVEASVRMTLGRTYEALGLYDAAQEQIDAAVALCVELHGEKSPEALAAESGLADLLRRRGELDAAEARYRIVLAAQREVLGPHHRDTLSTQIGLGATLWRRGDSTAAEETLRPTLTLLERVRGTDDPETLRCAVDLARALLGLGKLGESERLLRSALLRQQDSLGSLHPYTLQGMNHLGLNLERQGRLPEAERLFNEAFELDCQVLGREHPDTLIVRRNLVRVLRRQDRRAALRPYIEEDLRRATARVAERPDDPSALHACAALLLEVEFDDLRDPQRALELASRAATLTERRDAEILHTLSVAQERAGDVTAAVQTQREAVARAGATASPRLTEYEDRLVDLLVRGGDYLEVSGILIRRMAADSLQPEPRTFSFGSALAHQGYELIKDEQYVEAESLLRIGLALQRSTLPAGHWQIGETTNLLGVALAGQGSFEQAESVLLESYTVLSRATGVPPHQVRAARERIAAFYEDWGRPEQAQQWRGAGGGPVAGS